MKQFSLILNVVLLIAVGILYGKVFFNKEKPVVAARTATAGPAAQTDLAYIELDSLNEKIRFIKERRTQLEAEQQSIETEWRNGYRGLENQKNDFLKKGNAITQAEAEDFQRRLIAQQQQIDQRKQTATEKLGEKSYAFMDDIQKKLKDFMAEYNKDKRYRYIFSIGTGLEYMIYKDSALNVSTDVIDGMNSRYSK